MVRMQVQFTEAQMEAIKRRARDTGTSIAAVVRDSVDSTIGAPSVTPKRDPEAIKRFMALAGTFRSGASDVSVNHDEYLAEAIESKWRSS